MSQKHTVNENCMQLLKQMFDLILSCFVFFANIYQLAVKSDSRMRLSVLQVYVQKYSFFTGSPHNIKHKVNLIYYSLSEAEHKCLLQGSHPSIKQLWRYFSVRRPTNPPIRASQLVLLKGKTAFICLHLNTSYHYATCHQHHFFYSCSMSGFKSSPHGERLLVRGFHFTRMLFHKLSRGAEQISWQTWWQAWQRHLFMCQDNEQKDQIIYCGLLF